MKSNETFKHVQEQGKTQYAHPLFLATLFSYSICNAHQEQDSGRQTCDAQCKFKEVQTEYKGSV